MIYSHTLLKSRKRSQSAVVVGPLSSRSRTMTNSQSQRDSSHWPPRTEVQFETPDEAARKAALDWEAHQASEKIDLSISAERSRKRKSKSVKILLLGQSESGKSTTLRNFQLTLAPRAFQADAEAWRTVIHLNLLISVNYLLDVLKGSLPDTPTLEQQPPYSTLTPSRRLIEKEKTRVRSLDGPFGYPPDTRPGTQSPSAYSTELRHLMLSLLPLKSIEMTLRRRLGTEPSIKTCIEPGRTSERRIADAKAPVTFNRTKQLSEPPVRPSSAQSTFSVSTGVQTRHFLGFRRHSISSSVASSDSSSPTPSPTDSDRRGALPPTAHLSDRNRRHHRRGSRFSGLVDSFAVKVRGSTEWKRRARIPDSLSAASIATGVPSLESGSSGRHSRRPSLDSMSEQEERDLLSARQIIQVFGEDILRLWRNEDVQKILKRKDIRMETQPGFFLNDVLRITAFDYMPTTSDILRARLQTTGVEEHRLVLETGRDKGKEWTIFDVGGFRSQRAAWAPFFDSVNAIIFLAPISAFDEWLVEDPSVNRLEDTFHLWREICANKLLASVEFILFLNKYDALRAKLRSGIRFADYVVNFNDENGTKNDADSISRYLLATFNAAHKRLSPKQRKLRVYLTSVIDSLATAKVVNHISEQVLIGHLTESEIL